MTTKDYEFLFGNWAKWMGLEEGLSSEDNLLDHIVGKLGMNVNDLCEQIAKSNLSSFHPVDVFDRENHVEVWIDVPGFNKEDLDVRVAERGSRLTISGTLADLRPKVMYMKERSAPSFERTIQLPSRVTVEGCYTKLQNGVLQLSLPKTVPDKGTKVPL